MLRTVLLSSFLLAAACGRKSTPAASTTPATTSAEHAGHEGSADHQHAFPTSVGAFHDRMAPLWHADVGEARTTSTCDASGELAQLLGAVENDAAPAEVDAAMWTTRVGELRTAVTTLADDCAASGGAQLEGNFTAVHDAFHALIELLPEGGVAKQ